MRKFISVFVAIAFFLLVLILGIWSASHTFGAETGGVDSATSSVSSTGSTGSAPAVDKAGTGKWAAVFTQTMTRDDKGQWIKANKVATWLVSPDGRAFLIPAAHREAFGGVVDGQPFDIPVGWSLWDRPRFPASGDDAGHWGHWLSSTRDRRSDGDGSFRIECTSVRVYAPFAR